MKRNYRSLLSFALVLLLVAITALTFAYWDQLTKSDEGTVNIGQGKTITITETVPAEEGKVLVPTNVLMGENDVTEITVTYKVDLDAVDAEYDLEVEVETETELLNASVAKGNLEGKTIMVTITFTLDMPADEAEYNEVANKALEYTITFSYTK